MPIVNGRYVAPVLGPKPQQTAQTPVLNQAAPNPYLAKRVDAFGRPYYGEGIQGWARRTYATLFDPKNFDYSGDAEAQQTFNRTQQEVAENLGKVRWQDWGEKIFGITAEEIGQAEGAQEAHLTKAENEGESLVGETIAGNVNVATRIPAVAWDTFLTIVGITDHVARKIYSFNMGLADAAQSATVASPIKLNDWEQSIVNIANAVNPFAQAANLGKIANGLITGRVTFGEVKDIVSADMAASDMLYTALTDETRKNEFLSRYRAGEDAHVLAEELQNPWTELIGSVVGDPLTWEGAGVIGDFGKASTALRIPILGKEIRVAGKTLSVPWRTVGHLPSFGDALATVGVKVGKARLVDEVSKFTESVVKDFGPDLKAIANSPDAQKMVLRAAETASTEILNYSKKYGPLTLDSTGKAARAGRDASHVLYNLNAYANSTEEVYQVLGDFNKLFRGLPDERAVAAASLLSHPMGAMLTSEKGLQTGEFIAKLYDNGKIQTIIDLADGDRTKLAETLFKHYDDVLHSTFASVDDMHNAAVKVTEAQKTGKKIDEADKALAFKYDNINPFLKTTRNITRKIDKVHGPVVGTMGNVYIRWNPAFFAKNIEGQTIRIMMEMGAQEGLEIAGRAATTAKKSWAEALRLEHQAASTDMLGYVHEATNRGFGKTLNMAADSAANRAEGATSGEIAIRTIRATIQDALNSGAIPLAEELEKAMPGSSAVLIGLLKKYDGNWNKAGTEFRAMSASGFLQAEKLIEPPAPLRKFLADNHLLGKVDEIRNTSKTREEAVARLEELTKDMRSKVEQALASVPATIGDDAAKEMPVLAESATDAQALFHEGVVDFQTADGFTRMTQGWQNARNAMGRLVKDALIRVGGLLDEPGRQALTAGLNGAQEVNNSYQRIYKVRNVVRQLNEESQHGGVIADLYRRADVLNFNLAKTHPEIDPATLTRKQFRELLWDEYYAWSGKDFHAANISDYDAQMKAIEGAAKQAGVNLEDLLKPTDGQTSLLEQVHNAMTDAATYQREYFDPNIALQKALREIPKGTNLQDAQIPNLARFKGGKEHLFNAVNADRRAAGLEPLASMADATRADWSKALQKRIKVIPPPYNGEKPSYAMGLYKNLDGFEADMKVYQDGLATAWGQTIPINDWNPQAEKAFSSFGKEYESRMALVRVKAAAMATAKRDFLLHSYDKTYLDHAIAYLMPFHYWTDRTYVRTFEQLIENPGFAAAAAKFRDFQEKEHADLPPWWKYNVQIPNLLGAGADADHPLFMNINASLDPLNGLVGMDFNDPYKRVDWISKTVDDLNKFGPTFSPLIQWAVGLHLYNKGEVDAGQRWFGRLLPQTAAVKAGLTLAQNALHKPMLNAGKLIQNNEIDPFVNFIEGGLDPYEKRRVERALTVLQMQGVPEEQIVDAAQSQSGPLWDQAIQIATTLRAPGQLLSAVMGVGFKPRSENDMRIEQFYSELNHLYALGPTLAPEDFQRGWAELKGKYEFMDTLLLARKGGDERDAAFAYNVLGRVPPGKTDNLLLAVGLSFSDINKFYDSKGFTDKSVSFTATEKQRFMAAITDAAAVLKAPDTATKEAWAQAKSDYKAMQESIKQELGDDIWLKVSAYYDVRDTNSVAADQFKQAHPEVSQALFLKQQSIVSDPFLFQYYGSIDTIEAYYDGKQRQYLENKYGRDIIAIQAEYYYQGLIGKREARAYLAQHPELKAYWKEKGVLTNETTRALVQFASRLPSRPTTDPRADFVALNQAQEALAGALNVPQPSLQKLNQFVPLPLREQMIAFYLEGLELSTAANKELDYLATRNGFYNGDDLLREYGIAMSIQAQTLPQQ